MGKQLFYRQLEAGIAAAYDDRRRHDGLQHDGRRALDGVQAFIDKRPPAWGGKA
jgi:hypothetical protein